jgi:superfamily I DNA/RNA helicase
LTDKTHLFVVGDPRQSIFGFRGSDINYILNFVKKYPESNVVFLNFNYRSIKEILNVANESIRVLGLPDLKSADLKIAKDKSNSAETKFKDESFSDKATSEKVYLIQCENKEKEAEFISLHIKRLIKEKISPSEILILARTNFQIDFITEQFETKEISYVRKSLDLLDKQKQDSKKVVVSTIHAIKGLEAKIVFVMGLVPGIFPGFSKEKQILQELKRQSFTDSYDEELRLFYVAITRAKEKLFLTYYAKGKKMGQNPFFTTELLSLLKMDKY